MTQFGNLGLAAAGYNAGPGGVSAWLAGKRTLPDETRNYVAIITGWTVDEWASPSPPPKAETTIPQGVPCTRLAHLILAPKDKAQQIATHVPRWGAQLTSNWSESRAWETYRMLQRQYASLIGDREPIVLRGRLPGMGSVSRTIIRIGDDNRAPLDTLCNKLIAAGGACVVLRNQVGRARVSADAQSSGDAPPSAASSTQTAAFFEEQLEILVAVVEGDFLARHDRPQSHRAPPGLCARPVPHWAGSCDWRNGRIPSRRAVDGPGAVELEHVFGTEPALALMRLRGGNARTAIADDGCSACDRFGGERPSPVAERPTRTGRADIVFD